MVNFIQNVSMKNIQLGIHMDPGPNAMLIQIVDPCYQYPVPKYTFSEIYRFSFLDIENDCPRDAGLMEFAISQEQAADIARLLVHARDNRMNVIVHCHAGICRSGAVAEAGSMLGFFTDPDTYRQPNTLVKRLLFKELGFTNSWD